jgi:hypothetical protein
MDKIIGLLLVVTAVVTLLLSHLDPTRIVVG